jgi:branched-chain amino acid transport system ATP-binding protein
MTTASDTPVLECRSLAVAFAGLRVLSGVDLRVDAGEILGLIGPNGAGKTTLVNVLSGFVRPHEGDVLLAGDIITGVAPEQLAVRGLSRTFQGVRIFSRLTVRENVEVAASAAGKSRKDARAVADALLRQLGIERYAGRAAASLPYGDERRVALARALAAEPKVLLLDEPVAGLDEVESAELADVIDDLRASRGCAVLVIEHDMRLITRLCDRIQVLAQGETICIGTPSEVHADSRVVEAYLGSATVAA